MNDTEYTEFYKSTFRAYDEPLAKTHFSLEGQVEFKALLYIPSVVSEIAIFSKILHSDPVTVYVRMKCYSVTRGTSRACQECYRLGSV